MFFYCWIRRQLFVLQFLLLIFWHNSQLRLYCRFIQSASYSIVISIQIWFWEIHIRIHLQCIKIRAALNEFATETLNVSNEIKHDGWDKQIQRCM